MGSCISLASTTTSAAAAAAVPVAKVIALNGSLKEYLAPVTVSSVLGPTRNSCFLCSSDSLYVGTYIPALASGFVLELSQIYFVLPIARLKYPLLGSDMAAMAIRAGTAIARDTKRKKREGKDRRVRVVAPFVCDMDCVEPGDIVVKARKACRGRNRVRMDTIEEIE